MSRKELIFVTDDRLVNDVVELYRHMRVKIMCDRESVYIVSVCFSSSWFS